MKWCFILFVGMLGFTPCFSQYSFEFRVENAMQVGNTDEYSVSGTLQSGRIEKNKVYFLEDGTQLSIRNIISSKTATSVPVANAPENISLALQCPKFVPTHGDWMKAIATRPSYGGGAMMARQGSLAEGLIQCRVNGRMYRAKMVSKPVYVRASDMLDLFFMAEDESVVWLQLNGFSMIQELPHRSTSDTSIKEPSQVCKVVFMPKGYRPTDMPVSYKGYEDFQGHSGIIVTSVNRYRKTLSLEFSGTLRANSKMLEENPSAGLFYLTEGRVDQIGWDEF